MLHLKNGWHGKLYVMHILHNKKIGKELKLLSLCYAASILMRTRAISNTKMVLTM